MERISLNGFALFKKRAIPFASLLCTLFVTAQNPPTIVGQLPVSSPPSPTVAGLMKFEEVSVDHYTGIPDVSIPLYSVETLSKDISMDISLKYHPSSIAVEEVAGYTGLGWNLFAGGSVARNMKGSPDEISELGVLGGIGILQDNPDPSGDYEINRFNEVLALLGTPGLSPAQTRTIGEYGWGVAQKGSFDTQHDLWQYNFMGHTGRFFIKRDFATGNLVPVKLDNDNDMVITINYYQDPVYDTYFHRYNIRFDGFTLYDDNGYRYVFGSAGREMTSEKNAAGVVPYSGQLGSGGSPITTPQLYYASAFNLTEIWDNNDKLLVSFTYTDAKEAVVRHTESVNWITGPTSTLAAIQSGQETIYGLPARQNSSTITTEVDTKKLSLIEIKNKSRITFDTQFGRSDSNVNAYISNNSPAPYLNSMTVKNWYGDIIKQFSFTYDYATLGNDITRMILTGVTDKNTLNNGDELSYVLSYKNQYAQKGTKDYWGYYSTRKDGNKEPDALYCTSNVLEKMTLPTGGSILFSYGPNTYSFIGADPVTDFTIDNPYKEPFEIQIPDDGLPHIAPFPVSPGGVSDVFFVPESPISGGQFNFNGEGEQITHSINALGERGLNDGSAVSDFVQVAPNTKYYITYSTPGGTPTGAIGKIKVFQNQRIGNGLDNNTPDDQWLMGGGVRIDSITYFTEDNTTLLKKVKRYNYKSFTNPNISSGSLAFAKPIYKFTTGKTMYGVPTGGIGGGTLTGNYYGATYTSYTSHNSLSYIRTKGADVGYKNVTVSESGNGKSEYTYTSPIDYPGNPGDYEVHPPFRPHPIADYKRGLLLNVKHYSEKRINEIVSFKPLVEDTYVYPPEGEMNDQVITTGWVLDPSNSWAVSEYSNWDAFRFGANKLPVHDLGMYGHEEVAFQNLGHRIDELIGWPQLKQKISKEYFYPEGSTIPKIVTSTETYEYNYANKRLSSSAKTNSLNEIIMTSYLYDTNSDSRNRIGVIKRIESRRDNLLVDTKAITYSNSDWGTVNHAYIPKTISEAKGSNSLETSITFKSYDEYSNPIEALDEHGSNFFYIWGYNSSQPIAMVENMDYAGFTANTTLQSYVSSAVGASNANDSANLLNYLRTLQKALPSSARMTGFAYKPLVGVTTVMDIAGRKTTYTYDGYGRLKEVRDSQGKLLSENEYFYKNQ